MSFLFSATTDILPICFCRKFNGLYNAIIYYYKFIYSETSFIGHLQITEVFSWERGHFYYFSIGKPLNTKNSK